MAREQDSITGAWSLVPMTLKGADGTKVKPFGDDPAGRILYTKDGYMMTVMSRKDRAFWDTPDPLGGTTIEKAQALESYSTYAGRYTFDGKIVTHHIDLSLLPNWSGAIETRFVDMAGDRLKLTTEPFEIYGGMYTGEAEWRKV